MKVDTFSVSTFILPGADSYESGGFSALGDFEIPICEEEADYLDDNKWLREYVFEEDEGGHLSYIVH